MTKFYFKTILCAVFFLPLFFVAPHVINATETDTIAPNVSIISPKNNEAVYGSITIRASASDNAGVGSVEFFYSPKDSSANIKSIKKITVRDLDGNYSVPWNTSVIPLGQYNLIAKAIDTSGNTGTSSPVAVVVSSSLPQNNPPVIIISGDNPITILKRSVFTDPGATATDAEDGNLISKILKTGTVYTDTAGTYIITYKITDKGGLSSSAIRTVRVVSSDVPNNPPIISLSGGNKITVEEGNSFTDPGATAYDAEDGDLTAFVSKTGAVDTGTAGTYTILYSVKDRGIPPLSSTVSRTVIVSSDVVSDISKNTGRSIKDVLDSPYADPISKTIAVTGLLMGATSSLASFAFATPFSFSEIFLLPLRLWTLLLIAFGIKKRVRPWGTVYDAVTKRPLDPVVLELVDKDGKVVATAITDIDGRYGFITSPGHYMIRAKKTNYAFPSLLLGHVTRDEIYLDLYFGNYFEVNKEGGVITKNIPMDPDNFSWNEFEKKEHLLTHFYSNRTRLITRITDILFSIGFITALVAFLFAPHFYNIAIFALYVVMLIIKEVGPSLSKLGTVVDKNTGRPIPYAVIRVYSASLGNEVLHKITTQSGQFYCLVPNGEYIVTVEKKKNDETGDRYAKIFTSPSFDVSNGIIKGVWKV